MIHSERIIKILNIVEQGDYVLAEIITDDFGRRKIKWFRYDKDTFNKIKAKGWT